MNIYLVSLANVVQKLPRDNPQRKKASNLIFKDMPLILQDEYENRFLPQARNKGKDCVDFYFIKRHQVNKFLQTGMNPDVMHKPKPKEPEYKAPVIKQTRKIGDLIK